MQHFVFIRHGGRYVKVDFQHILYVEARKNYTRVVMEEKTTLTVLVALKQWEELLPCDSFCKVHKGYIVSLEKALSFDNKYVYLPGARIPIGYQYRTAMSGAVTILAPEPSRKKVFSDLGIELSPSGK